MKLFVYIMGIPSLSYFLLILYVVFIGTFVQRMTGTVLTEYLVILGCVTFATILLILKKGLTESSE